MDDPPDETDRSLVEKAMCRLQREIAARIQCPSRSVAAASVRGREEPVRFVRSWTKASRRYVDCRSAIRMAVKRLETGHGDRRTDPAWVPFAVPM